MPTFSFMIFHRHWKNGTSRERCQVYYLVEVNIRHDPLNNRKMKKKPANNENSFFHLMTKLLFIMVRKSSNLFNWRILFRMSYNAQDISVTTKHQTKQTLTLDYYYKRATMSNFSLLHVKIVHSFQSYNEPTTRIYPVKRILMT